MQITVVGASGLIGTKVVAPVLARKGEDTKAVVVDPEARYFGAALSMGSLVTPDVD